MFQGSGIIPIIFFVMIGCWLTTVSYFLFKTIHHYNVLIKNADKKNLSTILDQLVSQAKGNNQWLQKLDERLTEQEKKSQLQIQKIGLLRYNPFADTGGEQSFVVSLLDNYNNGMILTSLQGRSGTRWYAKQVKKGKGTEFDLSKEEEEAVKKARQLT
jgi:hypothetical protein